MVAHERLTEPLVTMRWLLAKRNSLPAFLDPYGTFIYRIIYGIIYYIILFYLIYYYIFLKPQKKKNSPGPESEVVSFNNIEHK